MKKVSKMKFQKHYIPVEKMSTKQYMKGIKKGLWGGKADPKVLKIIKNNPDNPWLKGESFD